MASEGKDFDGTHAINVFETGLYLSGSDYAKELDSSPGLDIKYVLSVFDGSLQNKLESLTYKKINASDDELQDLITYFPEANQFISSARESGEKVLVHSHAGISRSATIVVAYIMNKYQISYKSARAQVENHQHIMPRTEFVDQLKLYEEMGFSLNANNRNLRQHLLITILRKNEIWTTKKVNTTKNYYDRRDYVESITQSLDLGPKCLCIKCGQHLFNEIHIITNSTTVGKETGQKKVCDFTYFEPQKWIQELNEDLKDKEYTICCLNCNEEITKFSGIKGQLMQYWCDCSVHLGVNRRCLRLRISNKKFAIESND